MVRNGEGVYSLLVEPGKIDFAPAAELQEILQNVITICSTIKHSVPMDREFGIDPAFIDQPVSELKGKYTQEVVRAVRRFEPRARVTRIEFDADIDGKVTPRLFIKVAG